MRRSKRKNALNTNNLCGASLNRVDSGDSVIY